MWLIRLVKKDSPGASPERCRLSEGYLFFCTVCPKVFSYVKYHLGLKVVSAVGHSFLFVLRALPVSGNGSSCLTIQTLQAGVQRAVSPIRFLRLRQGPSGRVLS